MKKKKIVSLLMAALMIGQFLPSETMTAFAGESALVGKEQLADRHTVAPKKDSVVPNANQYEYQKQELAHFAILVRIPSMKLSGGKNMETKSRMRFLN